MAKILDFTGQTLLPIPPDKICQEAVGKLSDVVIIGYEQDTGEIYLAASTGRLPDVNFLLDQAKAMVLRMSEGEV